MIKAILWDNDGVLVDTEKLFFASTRKVLITVGIDLTRDLFIEFSLIRGIGLREYLDKYNVDTRRYEELRKKRNAEYSELLKKEACLIKGIKPTLKSLSGLYKMGIVTSSRREHFDIIHRDTKILDYFNFILTREDYKNSKPDPGPYLKGLERTGVKPSECVVIEDSARGLKAANQAGLFCFMIPNDLSRPDTYDGDYKLLENSGEIINYLA